MTTPETYPQLCGFYEGTLSFASSYIDILIETGKVDDPKAVKELEKLKDSFNRAIEEGKKAFQEIVKK